MTGLKILVCSDSHGNIEPILHVIEREAPDHVIHLGDHMRDADEIRRRFQLLPVLSVKGNCDFEPDGREQALAEFCGVRILAVHGHRYGVKSGLLRYHYAARESQVDVALFGHTHQAYCEQNDGLWLMNPGSCSGFRPSYGWLIIEKHQVSCQIKYLDDWR